MRELTSDTKQMLIVAKYEITKYLRGKKILLMLMLIFLIFALFITLPPALAKQYPSDSRDFSIQFLNFVPLFVILAVTFFGSDAIVGEFQQRTAYLLFPNPIKREVILVGKFIASFAVSVGTVALFYLLTGVSVGVIDGEIPFELAESFALASLYTFSALSVSYLVSAYMKNTISSAVLTFFLFFLILPIVDAVLTVSSVKPWFSLTFAGDVVRYILYSPYPVDTTFAAPVGKGPSMAVAQYYPAVLTSIGVMVLYAVPSLVLALYRFHTKDV